MNCDPCRDACQGGPCSFWVEGTPPWGVLAFAGQEGSPAAVCYQSWTLSPASLGREIRMRMMNLNQSPLPQAGASYVAAALLLQTMTLNVGVVAAAAFSADGCCHDDCSLEVAAAKKRPPCNGQQLRVDCSTGQPAFWQSALLHAGLVADSCPTGAAACGRAEGSASACGLPSGATCPCASSRD